MRSRDLSTELAVRARRRFREIIAITKPWAQPTALQRGQLFARAWEQAESEACQSLGYSSADLEVIRAWSGPGAAPGDTVGGEEVGEVAEGGYRSTSDRQLAAPDGERQVNSEASSVGGSQSGARSEAATLTSIPTSTERSLMRSFPEA